MEPEVLQNAPKRILKEVSKVVVGKEEAKELLLVALLSGGHVLIEGLVGTGKTTLARAFALAIGGEFKRIQMTPDTLPTDITGFYIYGLDGSSRFIRGPVFANILLVDELNRATPRTQSALLEAMQEMRVSVEGVTHELPRPFMVVATQVPYGTPGTYPLAETQVDRFMLRCWSDLPSPDEECAIIGDIDHIEAMEVEAVVSVKEVLELQMAVKKVFVSEDIRRYIISLVNRIREDPDVVPIMPSPRGSVALYKGTRALAFMEGRDYVIPDDVKRLAIPSLAHRICLRPEAEAEEVRPEHIIERALRELPVPKAGFKP